MKRIITTIFFVAFAIIANAQGIQFEKHLNWKQIKEKAKQENKYILVDAYATWCIPCKEMDANTFPKKEVGDFVNTRFIAVKIQMDQTKNDNEWIKSWYTDAKSITKSYEVNAFPTLLIFSSNADLAGKILGFRTADELIVDAKKIIEESEAFDLKYQAYLRGDRDSAYVKKIVAEAEKIGRKELSDKIAQSYINSLSDIELFKISNLIFVYSHTHKSSDKGFKVFRTQGKRADKIFGEKYKNASKNVVDKVIYAEEIGPYITTADTNWDEIVKRVAKKYGPLDTEYYAGIRMAYAFDNKLWLEFGKFYAIYFETAYSHSNYHINNFSWKIFQYVNDPKVLEVAIRTMKYNNEHFDVGNPQAIDTYANLLYKAGRKAEAITAEESAVELSKGEQQFVKVLEKMKRGEATWNE